MNRLSVERLLAETVSRVEKDMIDSAVGRRSPRGALLGLRFDGTVLRVPMGFPPSEAALCLANAQLAAARVVGYVAASPAPLSGGRIGAHIYAVAETDRSRIVEHRAYAATQNPDRSILALVRQDASTVGRTFRGPDWMSDFLYGSAITAPLAAQASLRLERRPRVGIFAAA